MQKTHGQSRTPLYSVWKNMMQRCYKSNSARDRFYRAKDIQVCQEWHDKATFFAWALSNGYRKGLSIDRINNEGNYCPENCRFITMKEQQRNRQDSRLITHNGVTKHVNDWAEELGLNPRMIHSRWGRGWRGDRLLEPPNPPKIVKRVRKYGHSITTQELADSCDMPVMTAREYIKLGYIKPINKHCRKGQWLEFSPEASMKLKTMQKLMAIGLSRQGANDLLSSPEKRNELINLLNWE